MFDHRTEQEQVDWLDIIASCGPLKFLGDDDLFLFVKFSVLTISQDLCGQWNIVLFSWWMKDKFTINSIVLGFFF